MLLTADQILKADDLVVEIVPCPEWGGDVKIRCMSALERDQFEETLQDPGTRMTNIRARMVAMSAVDEKNNLLFSLDQVEMLGKKNALPLDRCFDVAKRLSGFGSDIEEDAKKSETAP